LAASNAERSDARNPTASWSQQPWKPIAQSIALTHRSSKAGKG
jgi:hypothetical protein